MHTVLSHIVLNYIDLFCGFDGVVFKDKNLATIGEASNRLE